MTVCVPALANDGRAIVLVADKALTYGDNIYRPAMQSEGGVEKKLEICPRWSALLAGDSTVAEAVAHKAIQRIGGDHSAKMSHMTMMDCMKEAYQAVREEYVIDRILRSQLLTKETFIGRGHTLLPLNDAYMVGIAEQIRGFALNCFLLVAGFDSQDKGCVFTVANPGTVISHKINGYSAIGIGAEVAISRLAWAEAEQEDGLDMALYQAFEAKAYAEKVQGVGARSDVWVMVPGQTFEVPIRIQILLGHVFAYSSQVPFKRRARWQPASPPPRRWETTLRKYVASIAKSLPASQ